MDNFYIGKCLKCGCNLYSNDDESIGSEENNVGDYDFVCYPCQFEMMDNKTWRQFVDNNLKIINQTDILFRSKENAPTKISR